jgi:hypothetical protein
MHWMARLASVALVAMLAACGGGGGGGGGGTTAVGCAGNCGAAPVALDAGEVGRIISQAVLEAQARGVSATIAVVDRVGNVLGVFRMNGAAATFTISSGRGVTGGLEGVAILPSEFAAISKAITGAYLSSEGNAFTTRTASQIVQQNFNPGEVNSPSGPLFGVQFSQFSCSDLMRRTTDGSVGPKRSPLGLAADPGGLPLYKSASVASVSLPMASTDSTSTSAASISTTTNSSPLQERAGSRRRSTAARTGSRRTGGRSASRTRKHCCRIRLPRPRSPRSTGRPVHCWRSPAIPPRRCPRGPRSVPRRRATGRTPRLHSQDSMRSFSSTARTPTAIRPGPARTVS